MRQLELFQRDEISELRLEIEKMKQTQENVRRGLFARHNEVVRMIERLLIEYETINGVK